MVTFDTIDHTLGQSSVDALAQPSALTLDRFTHLVDEVTAAINWIFQRSPSSETTSGKENKALKIHRKPVKDAAKPKTAAKLKHKPAASKARTGSVKPGGSARRIKTAAGKPARKAAKKARRGASRKSGRRY